MRLIVCEEWRGEGEGEGRERGEGGGSLERGVNKGFTVLKWPCPTTPGLC